MLGMEVIEGEERLPVLDEALDRLRVLRFVGLLERVEGLLRGSFVWAIQMSWIAFLAVP